MMMAMAAALMLLSCDKQEMTENVDDGMKSKTITFTFGGDVSQSPMTRASLEEANITDLWLFDYVDGELRQTVHQQQSDSGFGAISLDADYGEHHLYFVASRGDTPIINETIISWEKPSDTFWQNVTLNIEPQTATSHAVILQRVATRLRITVTDEVPAMLASLNVTPSVWYYGIDYTTGEAADSRTTTRTVSVPATYAGTTGQLTASFYCLSPSTAWKTDITLAAKASDNTTISQIVISDVPMERNRITAFSGTLFTAGRTLSLTVDDGWDEEMTGTW